MRRATGGPTPSRGALVREFGCFRSKGLIKGMGAWDTASPGCEVGGEGRPEERRRAAKGCEGLRRETKEDVLNALDRAEGKVDIRQLAGFSRGEGAYIMENIPGDMLPEAHRRLAEVIGLEATLKLCEIYGGAPLYIPKLDALLAAQRARCIRAEYDGSNTAQLARRYGVSMRTVQTTLSEAPRRRIAR